MHTGNIRLTVLAAIILYVNISRVNAQADIVSESTKIQEAFKHPAFLSFDMKYTYAFEAEPSVMLDSSIGSFKISGNRYWGTIDSAEFMQNDSFALVVYKPGKLINVNKPKGLYPQVTGFAMLDSLVGRNGYTYSFGRQGKNRVITLLFPDKHSPYKKFSVSYDSVSYLVTGMDYIIREEYLTGEALSSDPAVNPAGRFMQVKIAFSNYQTIAFSSSVFDAGNYFIIRSGLYTASPSYEDYQVFISSPDLSNNQQPAQ
jgi:hypothetical protein